ERETRGVWARALSLVPLVQAASLPLSVPLRGDLPGLTGVLDPIAAQQLFLRTGISNGPPDPQSRLAAVFRSGDGRRGGLVDQLGTSKEEQGRLGEDRCRETRAFQLAFGRELVHRALTELGHLDRPQNAALQAFDAEDRSLASAERAAVLGLSRP